MKREWKRSLCRLLTLAMLAGTLQSIGFTARAADEAIAVTGTDGDGDIGTGREIAENEPAIPEAGKSLKRHITGRMDKESYCLNWDMPALRIPTITESI